MRFSCIIPWKMLIFAPMNMKQIEQTEQQIEQITELTPSLKEELLKIWETAVRSSHHFLTEADIDFFRPRVRDLYFPAVDLYVIRDSQDKGIAAFMGLSDDMVEMLFVSPAEKGKGFGTALLHYAWQQKHIHKVDVNEDNDEAYRFYLRRGYRVIGRDETDADGKPFPIIHLEK